MITLLSSGSKKILNKSKYNLHSDKMKLNIDPSYETNIKGKLSLDINMTASVDNNSSLLSVHERLYNEKHIIDERKKQLQQKYIKIDKFPQHSKSKSKSNERYSKKSQILKLSRSANNLSECFKNLQQSSQGCNQDDTSSAHNKSYGNITVNKVTEKLYQDAKRRQESISRLSKGKPRSRSSSNHRNLKSTKYLKETFERNFEQAVNNRVAKNSKLNYFNTSEILKEMGFMFSDQDHNDKADERMLFADFWKCLKGDENDGVSIENLKRLLLSIEGLFQSKQKDYPFESKQSKKD